MKIPAGTTSGKIFRLKGKGIQILGTTRRGDQHVKVSIKVPKKVSEERKQLLEKLRKLDLAEGDEEEGFFGKVKGMFS